MDKKIILAGALLALTGAMSPASAATPHVNPAFRGAAAYRSAYRAPAARTAVIRRSVRAPARVAVRLPYLRNLAAAPSARAAFRRVAGAAYSYRGVRPVVRAQVARLQTARRAVYNRLAYRGYGRLARRIVAARRFVASVAPTQTPAVLAPVLRAPAVVGGQVGGASYYSGGRTASGGFVGAATCAHRSLPFGTKVMVTNLRNARQTVCTVNDRGPFIGGRIVDLSRGAAGAIGMLGAGVASVRLTVLGRS